jgi:6-phosphogluconolactonase
MGKDDKYVAYVGTYTRSGSVGIHVYDLKAEEGKLIERSVAPINNASYLVISKDGKMLYSIEDEGVASFSIDKNGDLTKVNSKSIGGMRGDALAVDSENRFLFVGGYHDGKVTVMKLNEDGSIGEIAYGIFHQNLGQGFGERHRDHPKVTSLCLTPDERFLCAVDLGLNQIKIYNIDYSTGHLELEDIVRPDIDSGARAMKFSSDGRFAYVLTCFSNEMEVYSYRYENEDPIFELVSETKLINDSNNNASACNFAFSSDEKYIAASVDGFNGVVMLKRNTETGELVKTFDTLISGDFPKSVVMLPGDKYFATLNHDTGDIRTFNIDYKNGYSLMKNAPVTISKPNCIAIHKL